MAVPTITREALKEKIDRREPFVLVETLSPAVEPGDAGSRAGHACGRAGDRQHPGKRLPAPGRGVHAPEMVACAVAMHWDDRRRVKKLLFTDNLGQQVRITELCRDFPGDNDQICGVAIVSVDRGQVWTIDLPDATNRRNGSFSWSRHAPAHRPKLRPVQELGAAHREADAARQELRLRVPAEPRPRRDAEGLRGSVHATQAGRALRPISRRAHRRQAGLINRAPARARSTLNVRTPVRMMACRA